MINLFLLLASAQGFFLTSLILFRHGRLYANRFLGGLIGLYSLVLLYLFVGEMGFFEERPQWMLIVLGVSFLISPLHYLYVKKLTHPADYLTPFDWLHFAPFFLFEVFAVYLALFHPETILTRLQHMEGGDLHPRDMVFNWLIILQSGSYLGVTVVLLVRHASHVKDAFSSLDRIRLNWLRYITWLACGFVIIFTMENIFFLFGVNLTNYFTLSSVLAGVYVYALGYFGLSRSEVFMLPEVAASMHVLPALEMVLKRTRSEKPDKYERSGLSSEKARRIEKSLRSLMENEAPYADSSLTLTQLADKLDVSPHNLSEVINTRLNLNFFDFVNRYRLEKIKQDLTDPDKKNLKLLAIAFDAGFNSKTAFNTIFKKHTGLTPSEYRQRQN